MHALTGWALTRSLLLVIIPVVALGCSSKTATNGPGTLSSKDEWRTHHDAGKAAHARGDQETAEREFRKALDVAARERPPGLATAVSLNALAVLYIDAGRSSDAAPMLDEATRILEERGQTDDELFAMVLTNRGELAISQGRAIDAEREYRRSLAIGAVPKAVHDRAVRGVVASLCAQGLTDEAKQFGAELSIGCRNDRSSGSAQTEPPHGLSMKVFAMPDSPAVLPVATFEAVDAEVAALQLTIGRYPPRFRSEEQRQEIYTRWSKALIDARTLDTRGERLEEKLSLLSELYRQGHNLDVRGAAAEALATIERCLELYPRSRPCNLSASYFYLSTTGIPSRLERSERSLTVLRALAAPGLDDDAEAGFVWLALYREDRAEAARLIDRYLLAFPQSDRAEFFRKIQSGSAVAVKNWAGP